ncbi:MAG: VRR-NUC domain-containing protein [Proteobacteria bacterium]|nr:VRR-NUC domain-containing protein [Pseudomonadota bacterium]
MGAEKIIENNIKKYLRTHGYLTYKIHVGQYGPEGFPDLLVVKHGITSYFEVKRPGEGPSPIQIFRLKELRQAGCIAKPVWSDVDVIRALKKGSM